jgi:hypothetical protein
LGNVGYDYGGNKMSEQATAEKSEQLRNRLLYYQGEPLSVIFERIDECGGWPAGKKFLIVQHDIGKRHCYFLDRSVCDEWNSTLCSSDDYYESKLSPERRQSIVNEGVKIAIRKLGGIPK